MITIKGVTIEALHILGILVIGCGILLWHWPKNRHNCHSSPIESLMRKIVKENRSW